MEHYYTNAPTSKSDEREICYELEGRTFRYVTDHGVFSMDRVDHGSDILIRTVRSLEKHLTGSAVDIGCGYGAIGLTLAALYPEAKFYLIDVNDRAMELARKNAAAMLLQDRAWIGRAAVLPAEPEAQAVITNPPIRAGKEVIYGLFRDAYAYLASGGRFYAVIRKNQGAPSAVKELERIFGNCETVERQSGYHVLRCVK